jgi:hypothetical protein
LALTAWCSSATTPVGDAAAAARLWQMSAEPRRSYARAGEGYASGWNNGTLNSALMPKKKTASMAHPPGADCRA